MNRIALYHLETLLWISRLGTFGAAATRLNTSQPAISARMRELEAQIGVKLFQRQGRNMAFTVRGRELVKQCEALWVSAEKMLLAPNNFAGASGIVRIGSGEIAAASCLPAFLNDLVVSLPGLDLEVQIDLTAKLIDDLLDGTLDLVFAIGPISMPGLQTISLGHVELVWLASATTAHAMNKSSGAPNKPLTLWSLARSSPMHDVMVKAIKGLKLPHKSVNLCNNVRSMIDIVEHGVGIGLFPVNMVADKLSSGSLVQVIDQSPPPILLQAAIRTSEADPVLTEIFRRATALAQS